MNNAYLVNTAYKLSKSDVDNVVCKVSNLLMDTVIG